jgi:hypothetical protein
MLVDGPARAEVHLESKRRRSIVRIWETGLDVQARDLAVLRSSRLVPIEACACGFDHRRICARCPMDTASRLVTESENIRRQKRPPARRQQPGPWNTHPTPCLGVSASAGDLGKPIDGERGCRVRKLDSRGESVFVEESAEWSWRSMGGGTLARRALTANRPGRARPDAGSSSQWWRTRRGRDRSARRRSAGSPSADSRARDAARPRGSVRRSAAGRGDRRTSSGERPGAGVSAAALSA